MKATLRFDLEDKFQREAHLRCVHSLDLVIALNDVRTAICRADEEEWPQEKLISEIREILHDLPAPPDSLSS